MGARGTTVEDVLREGGFTSFHRWVMAVTGFAWTFVAMEILLISFVVFIAFEKGDPLFRPNEFVDTALLSSTLIGSLLGSVVIGRLSDRTGRQRLFQASILWYSVFTALAALSPNWETLFSLRVLAGLGLGGMLVVDPALLSEYLPPQSRGRYLVVLDFFWPLGFLVAIGLAFVFLNLMNNDWRLLFLAAAFPAFLAFVFRATIPESPYFLARSGRKEDAARVLSRVTGRTVDPAALAGVEVGPRPSVGALFRTKHVRASVVTIVVWIGLNFSYYGLFLWMPFVLAANRGFAPGDLYQLLFLSALAQLPGYLTSAYLVEKWGRRSTLAMFLVLGGLSGYVFATAQDFGSFLFGLFFVSFFNLGAWGAVYPYTAELFPTEFRSTAFGLAEGVGKITAVLSPFIFGVLLVAGAQDVLWPLTAIALSMVVGGAVAAVVGRETKGQPFH